MPAGAAMFPSPGRAVTPAEGCLLCQAGRQAGGGMQWAACRAPPTFLPPRCRAGLTAGGDVLRGLARAQGQGFLVVILRWGSGGQRRSRVHRNLQQKHHWY